MSSIRRASSRWAGGRFLVGVLRSVGARDCLLWNVETWLRTRAEVRIRIFGSEGVLLFLGVGCALRQDDREVGEAADEDRYGDLVE